MAAKQGNIPKFVKFKNSPTVYVDGEASRLSWDKFLAKYSTNGKPPKITTWDAKDVYMYDTPGAKSVFVNGIEMPDWGELQRVTGKENPAIRKEKTPDFYKYTDNDTVYNSSSNKGLDMTWGAFQNRYGKANIEHRTPAQRYADEVATSLIPTPKAELFTERLPYQMFWDPQQQYVSNRAAELYRPEFEKYQLNPFEAETARGFNTLQFNQGIGGGWRTGKAGVQQNLYNQAASLDRDKMEMDYGDTIQNVISQYQQNVADPYYQQLQTSYSESPLRNINTKMDTGAADNFISQYSVPWEA